ncbi:hypothetical protein E4U41_000935 [Claviceps citrina]|nr:hypothetical protein E4U41_000935 [Claviceps citrina]
MSLSRRNSTDTVDKLQLQLQVQKLTESVELLRNQLANQHSAMLDASAHASPYWTAVPLDAATDHTTCSTSGHSDFHIASLYGDAAASFASTCTPGLVDGFSGETPGQGPLASVDENAGAPDVGVHPGSYISTTQSWFDEQSFLASARTYMSPDEARSNIVPSAPPSMVSGLSALEPAQPLTRQNSVSGDGGNGAYMMRLPSSQSYQTEEVSVRDPVLPVEEEDYYAMSPTSHADVRADVHPDLLAIGSGFAPTYPPSPSPINSAFFLRPPCSQSMQRSVSNVSSASATSSSSHAERRLREALMKQLKNGKVAKIHPKPHGTSTSQAATPSTHRPRGGKAAPERAPNNRSRRPRGPKVYCDQCDEHPDGFRGDHELRRHRDAKHKAFVKKYVCRDPATVGLASTVRVIRPLSECKACISGKKYAAGYNATAHLRRTHFKEKPPRSRNKKPDHERRGGKGGGKWPSMSELKPWLEEVEVLVSSCDEDKAPATPDSLPIDGDGATGGDDEVDDMNWMLGQAADGAASGYNPVHGNDNYNYTFAFADAQPQHADGRAVAGAGDAAAASDRVAPVDEVYDAMSHANNGPAAYGMAPMIVGGVGFDQALASAGLYEKNQGYAWLTDTDDM